MACRALFVQETAKICPNTMTLLMAGSVGPFASQAKLLVVDAHGWRGDAPHANPVAQGLCTHVHTCSHMLALPPEAGSGHRHCLLLLAMPPPSPPPAPQPPQQMSLDCMGVHAGGFGSDVDYDYATK